MTFQLQQCTYNSFCTNPYIVISTNHCEIVGHHKQKLTNAYTECSVPV